MQLPDYVVEFLGGPVMLLLGTRSADGFPEAGRAVGLTVCPDTHKIELVVSRWQWHETVANITATGELAVTASRPADYVTYQLKGRATVREPVPDDLVVAENFARRMTDCLAALGVAGPVGAKWLCVRDPIVAQLQVDSVFVQTPGASAGGLVTGARATATSAGLETGA